MDNKKSAEEKKQKIAFRISLVALALVLVSSIVLFIVSTVMNGKTQTNFEKSFYPIKYEYYVESYAKEFNVDVCLVYGVIRTESGFNPDAVSQAGAIGLMQLMPDTFTWLQNYRTNFMPEKILDSKKLYEPKVNIEYGTYLLRFLIDHYNGDVSLAICAYNAGYGNVDNWLADGTISQKGVTSADIPFPETANYLDKVTESMETYRRLYYSNVESSYVYIPSSDEDKSESETDVGVTYENDDYYYNEYYDISSQEEDVYSSENDYNYNYYNNYDEIDDNQW